MCCVRSRAVAIRLDGRLSSRLGDRLGVPQSVEFELGLGLFWSRARRFGPVIVSGGVLSGNISLNLSTATAGRGWLSAAARDRLVTVRIVHLSFEQGCSSICSRRMRAVPGDDSNYPT